MPKPLKYLRNITRRGALLRPKGGMIAPFYQTTVDRPVDPISLNIYQLSGAESLGKISDPKSIPPLTREIIALADEAMHRGPFSVVDKTSLPPSDDPRDYWHPAPYYWPNPKTKDGIPFIERDGERVPGTRLYEPESERYDRSRLQRLFDDGTLLTLAWKLSGNEAYARHAAHELRHWFVNAETRMNPHLIYAQIMMTRPGGKRSSAGIIETKDFYYYLDAVRLLEAGGFMDAACQNAFRDWLLEFRAWLLGSFQGWVECAKLNNHGLLYDLQLASICAYLHDTDLLGTIFARVGYRLFQHFNPDGSQPYELVRTLSAHYCTFNLQGWINFAQLAEKFGFDLWSVKSRDGRCLRNALDWLLPHYTTKQWPHRQIAPFDWERLIPLAHAADRHLSTHYVEEIIGGTPETWPVCFHPHDGIPPAWQLRQADRAP
jgi:Alginate lyase